MTGRVFGRLTIVELDPQRTCQGTARWQCQCACGRTVVKVGGSLRRGGVKSCGCLPNRHHPRDLSGQRFGRLLVIERTPKAYPFHWSCRCDCGRMVVVSGSNLKNTKSCGCWGLEVQRERTKNRVAGTREHTSWSLARGRCFDESNKAYHYYGGRGITMCERWRNSFAAFVEDMGPCPPGLSIDRIDNEKDYEPGNCRWADDFTQANNRRGNRRLTFAGRTMTVSQWSRVVGISRAALWERLDLGWSIERALTAPLHTAHQTVRRTVREWSRRLA